MTRFPYAPVWCVLLFAVAGCGFTSSPADHLTFKPPAGWQGSPGMMGFMQLWKAPGNTNQVLMLFKSPKPLQASEVFNNADLKDARVVSMQRVTICGNQPAEFVKAQGTSQGVMQNPKQINVEMMMSNAGGTTYMAMYVYPVGGAPNADATAALSELCQKS